MMEPLISAAPAPAAAISSRAWPIDWRTSVFLLLLMHVLVWTWAGVAARSNLDAPGDMVEAYVWGQSFQWGYYKHPPLSAWIAGAWFSVVPEGHAGYALLAAINSAVGLAGMALLARRLLPADWALLAVAAAALTPGITTLCMRFNANAVLVSTWPWATALFVRMMDRGRVRDALLCGAACALAMLGKYYSAVLLATLLVSALAVPAWRRRFATAAPWIAIATLVVALLPHLGWLIAQSNGPVQYAQSAAHETRSAATLRALHFALAQLVFPALAFGLLAIALERGDRVRALRAVLTGLLRPRLEPAWMLAAMPILATMLATVATGARTASVWGLPIAAGVCLLAVSRARACGARIDPLRAARAMFVAWAAVVVLSPLLWQLAAREGAASASEPRAELAAALDRRWQSEFGTALPFVSGTRALAASVAFYAPSHPRYWSLWSPPHETPWVDLQDIFDAGGIVVCASEDHTCQNIAAQWSQRREPLRVAKHERGRSFAPRDYVSFIMPPRATPPLLEGD